MSKKGIMLIVALLLIAGAAVVYFILTNLIFSIIIGIIGAIVLFAAALIKTSQAETQNQDQEIESQIRKSISKARQDKFKSESNIQKLTQWGQDLIMNTLTPDLFPEGLPFKRLEVLENWAQIKEKHGNKVSYEVLDKCNDVVSGYLNQIELEKSKIKVFDKLQTEYEGLKEKIWVAKQNSKKSQRIDKQNAKLQAIQNDDSSMATAIELEYSMEDLNREVALKQEYFKQLEQLQYQYGDDVNSTEAVDFKQKIDEMLTNLDSK